MSALWLFYKTNTKVSLSIQLQYRVALAIWMIGLILEPIIYLSVWTSVANANGGAVGGFTPGDFAAYYIAVLIVMHFTQIWHMWEFNWVIRQGGLSARLLRPMHPIHKDASENLAYKFFMLAVVIPAVLVLTLLFQPTSPMSLTSILLFVPTITLAAVLAFILGWVIALMAFWTLRTEAINQTYFIAMFFFSGQLAPLELLPPFLQTLANLLPFRYIISFPTETLLGRVALGDVVQGWLIQGIWIGLCALLLRVVWRAGVRQYTAMGG
jgi:ABC-2 type transport system permease protein